MLRLIPAPLHRGLYIVAHAARRRWWRLSKPRLIGCRVLAFDGQGRLLLIRHSYGSRRWMLPGGGIGAKESPIGAALRELLEETGCTLLDPRSVAMLDEPLYGTSNRVHVITGLTLDQPRCDAREVIEARFFETDALPDDLAPVLQRGLPGWITAAKAGHPRQPAQR
jgi:8-oxo-dGTP pyrophosphatase MutT (NUDIX family)